MQKKEQSIWTTDITPHVVKLFTMDITPDFKSEFWNQDITHHVIGTLAVFGLVMSSFVTMAGVATVGVQVEVAFAQQASMVSQTAALAMGDNRPASAILLPATPMPEHHMGSTTMDHPVPQVVMASSSVPFCPKIARTIMRGNSEGTTTGDVGQLQQFIANHFGLDPKDVVTGHFGSTTESFLEKFQQEQGIPPAPQAGPLTRAAIARLCNPSNHDPVTTKGDDKRDNHLGSTSPMIGSTTPPVPPVRHDDMRVPPMPPKATTPTPVSYNYNSGSNTASIIEAVNEISEGYTKLFGAAVGLIGL